MCLQAALSSGLDTQKASPCLCHPLVLGYHPHAELLALSQPLTRRKVRNGFTWPLPDQLLSAQCRDGAVSPQNSRNTFHLESTPSLQLLQGPRATASHGMGSSVPLEATLRAGFGGTKSRRGAAAGTGKHLWG